MFKSERSLKFAAKRCQYLRWEVYELIRNGFVNLSGTRNAGMMVPSSCQVYCTQCDEERKQIIKRIASKLLNRTRFVWKNNKQYKLSVK